MKEYPKRNDSSIAEQWAKDVLSGKETVSKWVRLAVMRDKTDRRYKKKLGLVFHPEKGQDILNFFEKLKHTKGEWSGYNFILAPFQQWMLYTLFGWYTVGGKRRFNMSYVEMAKKNGKSALAAGIGLYLLTADGESESEVYSAATHKSQAKIVFEQAHSFMQGLIRDVPYFRINWECFTHNIHAQKDKSKFEALGKDRGDSTDGKNPNCNIIDEYHAWTVNDRTLFDSLETATVARRNPLTFIITTAGFNKEGPCYKMRYYMTQVLSRKIKDESVFAMVMTIDADDDWKDPRVWIKANPNLGITPQIDALQKKLTKALESPTEERNFKTKHLNIWVNADKGWLPEDVYNKNHHGSDKELLKGCRCYAGLDLAKGTDINAFVLFFDKKDTPLDYHAVLPYFWIPESKLDRSGVYDNVDYSEWVDLGLIEVMKGRVINYDNINMKIDALREDYEFNHMGYDTYIANTGTVQYFEDHELMISPIRQGFLSLTAPTQELENLLVDHQMELFDNPVMNWMFSNIEIDTDAAGNIKLSKKLSKNKIDGWAALVNAMYIWQYNRNEAEGSIYDERDLIVL